METRGGEPKTPGDLKGDFIDRMIEKDAKNILLKGADALSEKGFTQVPNRILRTSNLSPGAKLTYTMLLSYAWTNNFCFPGQETLARDIGITDRSVRTHIKELQTKSLVKITRRGLGKSNLYELDLRQLKSLR